jgi:hypothetical protein
MSNIVQGDSGTILQATISDDIGKVDITGAQITFTIKSATKRNVKQGIVVDGTNGVCQVVLNSDDVQDVGNFVFQAEVDFPNGNKFSSNIQRFKVDPKL